MKNIAIMGLMLALAFPVVSAEKVLWQKPMDLRPPEANCDYAEIYREANAVLTLSSWRIWSTVKRREFLREIEPMLRPETMEAVLRILKTSFSTEYEIQLDLSLLQSKLRHEAAYCIVRRRFSLLLND